MMPRSAYMNLILLSLIWGASFFFIKILLTAVQPWTVVMLRSLVGLAVLFVIMVIKRDWADLRKLPWIPLIATGCLNMAIPWGLITMSEQHLTSSVTSVLNATTPLWTMLIGLLFFRMKSSPAQWIGIGLGFVGILILLDLNTVSIISIDLLGFFGMIAATTCYGFAAHLAKKYLSNLSSIQVSLFTLLFSAIVSSVLALGTEEINWSAVFMPQSLLALCGLGMFGSGFAYVLYYMLIQKGGAEFTSMVTYLVPVTAILWGYALLDEAVHWNLLVGLVCISGGVFFAGRASRKTSSATSVKKAASV